MDTVVIGASRAFDEALSDGELANDEPYYAFIVSENERRA
jgi:hypothetical protein